MQTKYVEIIDKARAKSDSLLNSMHALQDAEGYLTEAAVQALAETFDIPVSKVYDTASFYSMLRFTRPAETEIQICRGSSCHVAGARDVIAAFEYILDIHMDDTTADGKYGLYYSECIGRCGNSPSILVNGQLFTEMTPEKVYQLINKGGRKL